MTLPTLPVGLHGEILTARDIVSGEPLIEVVLWADRVDGACPRCGQPIERNEGCPVILNPGAGLGGALEQRSMQHGCGEWLSVTWVSVGEGDMPAVETITNAAVDLAAQRAQEVEEERIRTRRRLRRDLAFALERIAEAGDDPEVRAEAIEDAHTGSETEPGVYRDDHRWIAWDYDPDADGEITVTENELRAQA